ncbi:E3 ubiquitin-protein ligase RNF4 isoform X2 [Lingula anatina]|nr:E3 ubiquitin-protein ligase RNF4 isoform X2 [Lingula anatina]|eukprot:XP_013394453.1 E3 ubiquitin-protein ligase RNF4 isoform X2 [Lingula anatina]
MLNRRRTRRGTRQARRQLQTAEDDGILGEERREEPEPINLNLYDNEGISGCIDLTNEDDDQDEVVDLTVNSSVNDSPVVVLESQGQGSTSRRRRRRRPRLRYTLNTLNARNTEVLSSDDEIEELPSVSFHIPESDPERFGMGDAESITSPKRSAVSCPICMDNEMQIKASGRQLQSTVCGHIFCNVCIRCSIQTSKKCPTCRKKLNNRSVHPIFI